MMKGSTKVMLPLAGLFLLVLLVMPAANAAIGGEASDRSMVTTESGKDTFYFQGGKSSLIVWDMLEIGDRKVNINMHVINPDGNKRDIRVNLSSGEDEDWSMKIIEIRDSGGNNIIDDDEVNEIVEDREYDVLQVDGGDMVTVVLEVEYEGDEDDVEKNAFFKAQVLKSGSGEAAFSSTKELTFETSDNYDFIILICGGFALLGLIFAFFVAKSLMKREVGDEKLKELSGHIRDGANAFLNSEYKVIIFFIVGIVRILRISE
jgi:hypothetical protein